MVTGRFDTKSLYKLSCFDTISFLGGVPTTPTVTVYSIMYVPVNENEWKIFTQNVFLVLVLKWSNFCKISLLEFVSKRLWIKLTGFHTPIYFINESIILKNESFCVVCIITYVICTFFLFCNTTSLVYTSKMIYRCTAHFLLLLLK